MGAIAFPRNLLALGQHSFGAPQTNGDMLATDALHGAIDQLAFTAGEIFEKVFALGFAHALQQYLFGSLGSDTAEIGRGAVDHDQITQLRIRDAAATRFRQQYLSPVVEDTVHNLFFGIDRRFTRPWNRSRQSRLVYC